jgi:hypothetical protein
MSESIEENENEVLPVSEEVVAPQPTEDTPIVDEPTDAETEEPVSTPVSISEEAVSVSITEKPISPNIENTEEAISPKMEKKSRDDKSRSRRQKNEEEDTYVTQESDGALTKAMDRVVDFLTLEDRERDADEEYTVFSNDSGHRTKPSIKNKLLDSLDKHVLNKFGCSHPIYGDDATVDNDQQTITSQSVYTDYSYDESTIQTRSVATPRRSRRDSQNKRSIPEGNEDDFTYDDPSVRLKELDDEGDFLCGALDVGKKASTSKKKESNRSEIYSPSKLQGASPSFDGSENPADTSAFSFESISNSVSAVKESIITTVFPTSADDEVATPDVESESENKEEINEIDTPAADVEAPKEDENLKEPKSIENSSESDPSETPFDEKAEKPSDETEEQIVEEAASPATLTMQAAPIKKKKKSILKRLFSKKSKKKSKKNKSILSESPQQQKTQPAKSGGTADRPDQASDIQVNDDTMVEDIKNDLQLAEEQLGIVPNPMDPELSKEAKTEAWKSNKAPANEEPDDFDMIMSKNAADDSWASFTEASPKRENKATKFATPTKDANGFSQSLFASSPAHVGDFPAE